MVLYHIYTYMRRTHTTYHLSSSCFVRMRGRFDSVGVDVDASIVETRQLLDLPSQPVK